MILAGMLSVTTGYQCHDPIGGVESAIRVQTEMGSHFLSSSYSGDEEKRLLRCAQHQLYPETAGIIISGPQPSPEPRLSR